MRLEPNHILRGVAFAAATLSLVVAASFAMLAQPADADAVIFDLSWGERPNTARFVDVLQRMGHEEPRPFDLNGNRVFVTTARIAKSPKMVLRDYQHALRVEGLNRASFASPEAARSEEGQLTALTGGLVPTAVSDNYVAMGGVVPANDADDAHALAALAGDREIDRFKAFRSIEAFRQPGQRWTTVVATFSDEKFDYSRMVPGKERGDVSFDPTIPSCPGCVRLQRFADLSQTENVATIWSSPAPADEVLDFYRRALSQRGWALQESLDPTGAPAGLASDLAPAQRRLLFVKDGLHASVSAIPNGRNGTHVDVRIRR